MNEGVDYHRTDELLIKLINDDEKALEEIIYLYHEKMICRACLILNDMEEARDVVNDVFFKLWNTRHKLKPNTSFDRFLTALTKNSSISVIRKKSFRIAKHAEFEYIQPAWVIEDPLENAEMKQQIATAIESLPLVQKSVFCSMYI